MADNKGPFALRDELLREIGDTVSVWAALEEILFTLCHCALGATAERTAIVFGRTPSTEGRLNLTDELVRSVLPQQGEHAGGHDHPDVKKWKTIVASIKKLMPIRNAMIHRSSMAVFQLDDNSRVTPLPAIIIQPEHDRKRGRVDTVGRLDFDRVAEHRKKLGQVFTEVHNFVGVLRGYRRRGRRSTRA